MDDPYREVVIEREETRLQWGQHLEGTQIYLARSDSAHPSDQAAVDQLCAGDLLVAVNGVLVSDLMRTGGDERDADGTIREQLHVEDVTRAVDRAKRPLRLRICRRSLMSPARLRDRLREGRVHSDRYGFARAAAFVEAERDHGRRTMRRRLDCDREWSDYFRLIGGVDRLSQSQAPGASVAAGPAHLPRCRLPDAPLWRSPARDGFPDRPILRHLVRRGVPVAFRASVWLHFTGAHDRAQRAGKGYFSRCLAASVDPATADAVAKDVDRTFPMQAWFATAAGRAALRDVLLAFAAHNDRVGYCQSLNFLAGTMLLACGGAREDAFWLLVQLVEDVYPPDSFSPTMLDAFVDQRVVERLLRARNPPLMAHLEALHVPVASAALEWLLCGFATSLPMETALRVWDAALVEGRHVMFRAAAALLDAAAPRLLACTDPNTMHRTLHAIGASLVDADWLVDRCMDCDAATSRVRAREAWLALGGKSDKPPTPSEERRRNGGGHASARDGARSEPASPGRGSVRNGLEPSQRRSQDDSDDGSRPLGAARRRAPSLPGPLGRTDSGGAAAAAGGGAEAGAAAGVDLPPRSDTRHGALLRGFSPRPEATPRGRASEPRGGGSRPESPVSGAGSEGPSSSSPSWRDLSSAPRQWWARRHQPNQTGAQTPLHDWLRRLTGRGPRWGEQFSLEGISRLRAELYPGVVDEIARLQALRAGFSASEA